MGVRSSRLLCLVAVSGLCACAHVPRPCEPSTPPVPGAIVSCCTGVPPGYWWTGSLCVADEACQCEATLASPEWPTMDACLAAHQGCRRR
jgi:hypothetical protein